MRAVAFDLWETLITDTPQLSRGQSQLRMQRMEQILVAHGFGAVAERIEHAHAATWRRCQDLYWSSDKDIPCRRQIEHFLEALELDPATFSAAALDELEHAYAHAALELPPNAVEGAPETLRELHERGYRIGLISNTGRTPGTVLRRILEHHGMARHIDVMVFSNEHGACKPQRSIFEELRRGLRAPAEEIVFVGDNLYVDVHGAQSVGMRGIHFVPPVKGTAIAPHFEHGLEIVPDATITSLRELPDALERLEWTATSSASRPSTS